MAAKPKTQPETSTARKKAPRRRRRGAWVTLDGASRRSGIKLERLKAAIRSGELKAFPNRDVACLEIVELDRFAALERTRPRNRDGSTLVDRHVTIAGSGKARGFVATLRQRLARVVRRRGAVAGMTLESNGPGDSALRNHSHDGIERVRRALRGERGVLTAKVELGHRRREFARQRLRKLGG